MGRISGPQLETVIYANMRFNLPRKNWGEFSLFPKPPSPCREWLASFLC